MLHALNLVGRVRGRVLGRVSLLLWAVIALWLTTQSAQFLSGQLEKNFGSPRVTMAPSIHPELAQPASAFALSDLPVLPDRVSSAQPSGSGATSGSRPATSSLIPGRQPKRQRKVLAGLMLLRTLQASHHGH